MCWFSLGLARFRWLCRSWAGISPPIRPRSHRVIGFIGTLLVTSLLLFTFLFIQPSPMQATADADACAPIVTSTTWASGVYTALNCNIVIPTGVTLTLQPGVVIKFAGASPGYGSADGSAALIVDGALVAQGTATQPVVFTSFKDDAHGGDTNGNGASNGAAGDWYGLVFRAGSSGQLDHFFVGYAGSGVFSAVVGYGRGQIDVRNAAIQLHNGVVTGGLTKGIFLEGADIAPVIQSLSINDNHASNGRGFAVYQERINMQPAYANLSFSGNDTDQVVIDVGVAMSRSVTLGGGPFGFFCGYTLCLINVPTGATLSVQPGTNLDFGPSYGINVASGGALLAEGTVTQPITFTSSQAAAGIPNRQWIGLWAKAGSTLRLNHCDVGYASSGNFGKGGVEINTGDAQVRNCAIHHNAQEGVYIASPTDETIAPVIEHVDVVDNGTTGLYLDARYNSTLRLAWDGGAISRNGWSGVAGTTSASTLFLTLKNLDISHNGGSGDFMERRKGIAFEGAHNVNLTLENVTINHNVDAAITWYCNGSITASNLSAADNGKDVIHLPGCGVGSARQWDLGDVGIAVHVNGSIEVAKDAVLSIQPGTTLYFDRSVYDTPVVLRVAAGGALYALGSAGAPIRFLGSTASPGAWSGIEAAYDQAALFLRHCEIGYGGGNVNAALSAYGHSAVSPSPLWIQNCEIHHSSKKGVYFNWVWTQPPLFRNNSIHDNAEEGVVNWNAPELDARNNWWGDASGPFHAVKNPNGQGENVGDNILFEPWLTSAAQTTAPAAGDVFVSTGGPALVSPGQTADYGVQVLNLLTRTVNSAVVVVQLPRAADYVESSHNGIYWPERHQIFWKLGNLTPDSATLVSVRVRFPWGLPRNYQDGTLTLFAADNYPSADMTLSEYLNYAPVTPAGRQILTQAQFDALRAASAELDTLYSRSLAQGFTYVGAARQQFSDGDVIDGAVLQGADKRSVRTLTVSGGLVLATTASADSLVLEDTTGGMTMTLSTTERVFWGDWRDADVTAVEATAVDASAAACTPARCKINCVGKKITFKVVTSKVAKVFFWTLATGGTGSALSTGYEIYQITKEIKECNKACDDDPSSNCCTAGQVRWSVDNTLGIFGVRACIKEECNATTGAYGTPGRVYCTASGQRCVAGYNENGGCKACTEGSVVRLNGYLPIGRAEEATCAVGSDRCSDVGLLVAKDPNALYGPAGDLLPGQQVTYTITYENEGAGRAYGVYVVNELPAQFDEATLAAQGDHFYLAEDRQLVWLVGELGPKGDADSTGAVTYTLRLKDGLPSGTVIFNQATVYFPSVPEETPTNAVINQIAPLAAIPQQVETEYATPTTLTLRGRDAADLPLSFVVVDAPLAGALTGTPPEVTYTPPPNFTGVDAFTFVVSNGVTTSAIAQVHITVLTSGDQQAPVVTSIAPTGASSVPRQGQAIFTDSQGAAYAPALRISFSEALDPATVTSSTIRLEPVGKESLSLRIAYDSQSREVIAYPVQPLPVGEYTLTISTGVTDLAGNALPQQVVSAFSVVADTTEIYLPSLHKSQ